MLSRQIVDQVRGAARGLLPTHRRARAKVEAARSEFERALSRLARSGQSCEFGMVLVDAMYDNPNHWLRLNLLRAALGLSEAREAGILGRYRRRECERALSRMGIGATVDILPTADERRLAAREASRLLARISRNEQLNHLDLPFGFPGSVVYDQILKMQRSASVALEDGNTGRILAESIAVLYAADRLLSDDVDLLILSHAQGVPYAQLAWVAASKKIPAVNLAGGFGSLRYTRIAAADDIFAIANRPSAADISALSPLQIERLKDAAQTYLTARFAGQAGDLGAVYAYDVNSVRLSRQEMIEDLGMDPSRPLVIVYASHWFDMPHIHGMRNFRDFLDWILTTVDVAKRTPHVNWLFKSHPCEDWYGGIKMHEISRRR